MEIQVVPIGNVIPYENNPRVNDDAVGYVANSLKEFGWQQPIVVDRNFIIIAGHTRLLAAQSLEMTEVPVVIASELSAGQIKAFRLADNKVSEKSYWDDDKLQNEMSELVSFNMNEFAFESFETGTAFGDDDTSSLNDNSFDEPDDLVDMFNGNIKVTFKDAQEMAEAREFLSLGKSDKKVTWASIKASLK